jgi:hypothetical protein
LIEKWIPPSRSETAEIGQKTEGILGVNGSSQDQDPVHESQFLIPWFLINDTLQN